MQKVMITIIIQILSNMDIIYNLKISNFAVHFDILLQYPCPKQFIYTYDLYNFRDSEFSQYFNMSVGGKKIIIASLMIILICLSALFLISQCYILILNNEKCGMERKIGLETIRNFEKSEDDKIEFRKLQSMASIKNQVI